MKQMVYMFGCLVTGLRNQPPGETLRVAAQLGQQATLQERQALLEQYGVNEDEMPQGGGFFVPKYAALFESLSKLFNDDAPPASVDMYITVRLLAKLTLKHM
jgi:hypothetical protein